MALSDFYKNFQQSDFGPNDSAIASALRNPKKGASLLSNWFQNQILTASNAPDQYDNPNPLQGYSPEQQINAATNLAGFAQTGSFPFAPSSQGGTLGTMIGESGAIRAGYGDLINKAKELYANNVSPEEIWKQTRTMMGPDNKWMHEVSDVGAKLTVNGDKINFYHPELEKAYPEYSKIPKKYGDIGESLANFTAGDPLLYKLGDRGKIKFNKQYTPNLSTMLHEMQHFIQNHPENKWEPGISPNLFDPNNLMEKINKIPSGVDFPKEIEKEANAYGLLKNQKLYSPYEMYLRNFGEAMARNTQERMNMYPDQLAKKYWIDTLDVPVDELTKTKMPFTKFGKPKTSLLNWMEPP